MSVAALTAATHWQAVRVVTEDSTVMTYTGNSYYRPTIGADVTAAALPAG